MSVSLSVHGEQLFRWFGFLRHNLAVYYVNPGFFLITYFLTCVMILSRTVKYILCYLVRLFLITIILPTGEINIQEILINAICCKFSHDIPLQGTKCTALLAIRTDNLAIVCILINFRRNILEIMPTRKKDIRQPI